MTHILNWRNLEETACGRRDVVRWSIVRNSYKVSCPKCYGKPQRITAEEMMAIMDLFAVMGGHQSFWTVPPAMNRRNQTAIVRL